MSNDTSVPEVVPAPSLITITHLVYALHALSLLIGITTAATIIGAFVFGLGVVLFVWMLGSLRSVLFAAEGGTGRLATSPSEAASPRRSR